MFLAFCLYVCVDDCCRVYRTLGVFVFSIRPSGTLVSTSPTLGSESVSSIWGNCRTPTAQWTETPSTGPTIFLLLDWIHFLAQKNIPGILFIPSLMFCRWHADLSAVKSDSHISRGEVYRFDVVIFYSYCGLHNSPLSRFGCILIMFTFVDVIMFLVVWFLSCWFWNKFCVAGASQDSSPWS